MFSKREYNAISQTHFYVINHANVIVKCTSTRSRHLLNGRRNKRLQTVVALRIVGRDTGDMVELTRIGDLRFRRQWSRLWSFLGFSFAAGHRQGDVLRIADQLLNALPNGCGCHRGVVAESNYFGVI